MVTVLSTGPYWNANFNFQNAKHIWQYLTFDFAAIRNLSRTIEEVQVPESTKICQNKHTEGPRLTHFWGLGKNRVT